VRALITGGGGQLASDLQDLLGDEAVSRTHAELDITDPAQVDRAFDEVKPDVVFNCAAFHNVDQCEREPDPAWATNVRAVRDLAKRDAKLVHLSTNYVFDGRRDEPYDEDDLQRMLGRARDGAQLKMVSDQRLQPTFTYDLARALADAVSAGQSGLLHLTNSGACSWLEFTEAILENAGIEVPIEAVETTIGPGGVDRPLNGVLATGRATDQRPWREALDDYMARAAL